ncbi:hypothetical protein NSB25_18430 [Acetatifactor muris]|uniref:hypothetical protein n=1 Tax=Acetatifactor muris TaxID=879566 RepID=UPI001FA8F8B1|nr:hypothetical protein [Acetatifactor muris]MCR2049245.1 hypothetical protein [Acetatifactor muris]
MVIKQRNARRFRLASLLFLYSGEYRTIICGWERGGNKVNFRCIHRGGADRRGTRDRNVIFALACIPGRDSLIAGNEYIWGDLYIGGQKYNKVESLRENRGEKASLFQGEK